MLDILQREALTSSEVVNGDYDQIVPTADSAALAFKLGENGT